jgi:hypothetical protein
MPPFDEGDRTLDLTVQWQSEGHERVIERIDAVRDAVDRLTASIERVCEAQTRMNDALRDLADLAGDLPEMGISMETETHRCEQDAPEPESSGSS